MCEVLKCEAARGPVEAAEAREGAGAGMESREGENAPQRPTEARTGGTTGIRTGNDTWTFHVVFEWTGPDAALDRLRELGPVKQLPTGEFVWTCPISGDPGPGTEEHRAARAEWLAGDVLSTLLLQEHLSPGEWFTHRSTTRVDDADVLANADDARRCFELDHEGRRLRQRAEQAEAANRRVREWAERIRDRGDGLGGDIHSILMMLLDGPAAPEPPGDGHEPT